MHGVDLYEENQSRCVSNCVKQSRLIDIQYLKKLVNQNFWHPIFKNVRFGFESGACYVYMLYVYNLLGFLENPTEKNVARDFLWEHPEPNQTFFFPREIRMAFGPRGPRASKRSKRVVLGGPRVGLGQKPP